MTLNVLYQMVCCAFIWVVCQEVLPHFLLKKQSFVCWWHVGRIYSLVVSWVDLRQHSWHNRPFPSSIKLTSTMWTRNDVIPWIFLIKRKQGEWTVNYISTQQRLSSIMGIGVTVNDLKKPKQFPSRWQLQDEHLGQHFGFELQAWQLE